MEEDFCSAYLSPLNPRTSRVYPQRLFKSQRLLEEVNRLLLSLLDLAGLLDGSADLLLSKHELEPLEVGEVRLNLGGGELLGPLGGGPLGHDAGLRKALLEDLLGAAPGDVALEVRERQPLDGDLLARDAGIRTVDDHTLQIDDVHDGHHLLGEGPVADEGQTARLHVTREQRLRHCECLLQK